MHFAFSNLSISSYSNAHTCMASTLVVFDWLVDHGQRLVSPGDEKGVGHLLRQSNLANNPGLSGQDVVVELDLAAKVRHRRPGSMLN